MFEWTKKKSNAKCDEKKKKKKKKKKKFNLSSLLTCPSANPDKLPNIGTLPSAAKRRSKDGHAAITAFFFAVGWPVVGGIRFFFSFFLFFFVFLCFFFWFFFCFIWFFWVSFFGVLVLGVLGGGVSLFCFGLCSLFCFFLVLVVLGANLFFVFFLGERKDGGPRV